MQWWYGHNAVGFFLTTPFLGLMYYFLPKIAGRPIYSYRLSIIHFWALVFLYIWAGPHHLLYSALPEWAQTLGMVFSIMLLAPSWGGMLNGLLTLRGAWDRVRTDPILKFLVVAVSFYGMSTFEGPMMSIRAVNSLSHFTNWTIGHVHSGALGWDGHDLVRHPLLAGARACGSGRAGLPRAGPRPTSGWRPSGSCSTPCSMWAAGLDRGPGVAGARRRRASSSIPTSSTSCISFSPSTGCACWAGGMYLVGAIMMAWNFLRTVRGPGTVRVAPAVATAS